MKTRKVLLWNKKHGRATTAEARAGQQAASFDKTASTQRRLPRGGGSAAPTTTHADKT